MSIYLSVRKEFKFPLLVGKRGIIGMGVIMAGIALPLMINMPYYGMFAYYATLMFVFGLNDDYCQYANASDDAKDD